MSADATAMTVIAAEHAVHDLRALLRNGVTLTHVAADYVADQLTIIELGLEAKRLDVGLTPRQQAA